MKTDSSGFPLRNSSAVLHRNMDEQMKKVAALPSNYVTLQQLQEKQIKEQHQKQKEIEEGKKLQKALQSVESKSTDVPLHGLKQKKKKAAEKKIEVKNLDGEAKTRENALDSEKQVEKAKIKRKNKNKKKKPQVNENLVGDLESVEKEKRPKASPIKPTANEIQTRLQSKRENRPEKSEQKPQANRMAEIAGKFRDLTIDDGEGLKTDGGGKRIERSTADDGYDSRRFRFSRGKPKSTGAVWVRKEDIPADLGQLRHSSLASADTVSPGSRLAPAIFTRRRR